MNIEKSPSLRDTLSKISSIGKEEEGNSENKGGKSNSNIATREIISVDEKDIISSYEVYLSKIKSDQPRLHSAMKGHPPVITESKELEIFFQNAAQLEEFKSRLKPSLISHMCESLSVSEMEVLEKVVDAEKLARPRLFSDNEKFKQLSEKNPALLKLKNKFNLDFD